MDEAAGSRRVLAARAQALARVPQTDSAAGDGTLEVVEFLLAHERYAVEATYVREVLPLGELTPMPCTPPFVLGIVNVRGRILSVIDLKRFFDLPEKGLTNLNRVILIGDGDMEFCILADEVLGTARIAGDRVQSALPTLTGIRAQYLKGIADGPVVLLDAARVLSDPGIVVDEDVEA